MLLVSLQLSLVFLRPPSSFVSLRNDELGVFRRWQKTGAFADYCYLASRLRMNELHLSSVFMAGDLIKCKDNSA